MKLSKNALWRVLSLALIAVLVLSACTPAQQEAIEPIRETVVVEVTKAVEVIQTVEVEKVVEVTSEAPAMEPEEGGVMLNPDVSGEVEIWHFWASPVRRNAIRRVIAICQEKLPNITVTDTVKPFGDIWTANVAAVAAGSGMPDVIISDRPTLPKDAADGVYMDLQPWADRDGVTRDQFYDWAWDQSLFEGSTYGIPFETDVRVLFYNKQAFMEAGLDPEDPPETWQELEEYADALDVQNDDGTYDRIGFFPLWNAGFNPFWAYLNGATLINEDGTPALNDPKAVEAMQWIKEWVDRYGGWTTIEEFRTSHGAPPNDLFMSGDVAMFTDIYGYNSQLQFYRPQVPNPDDPESMVRMDWGIAPLPYNEGAGPANWSGGFSMSIPNGADNAEAAWEFIKCATGAEGQSSWARDTQAQPTNLVAASDPVLLADPTWGVVDESLQTSTGGVYVQNYPNWNEQVDLVDDLVWSGELTPEEALNQAQEAVEAAVAAPAP